jgi:hypothetical protein
MASLKQEEAKVITLDKAPVQERTQKETTSEILVVE